MRQQLTKEADLFQAVHELFFQQGSGERRNGPRHPYKCMQLLAPYNGAGLPRQQDFSWVECRNLSTRGLSFFWPEPPAFKRIVMALGEAPFIFVVGRLVHAVAEGEQVLCGCEFESRITRSSQKPGNKPTDPAELDRDLIDALVTKRTAAVPPGTGPEGTTPTRTVPRVAVDGEHQPEPARSAD
jgi:hypothetical protein